MVRIHKEPHAPSKNTDLQGLTGQRRASQCLRAQSGYGFIACPYGIGMTAGVQAPPTLSSSIDYAERGNAVTPPCAMHGRQTVRHADGGTALRGWKKQRPFGNRTARA